MKKHRKEYVCRLIYVNIDIFIFKGTPQKLKRSSEDVSSPVTPSKLFRSNTHGATFSPAAPKNTIGKLY